MWTQQVSKSISKANSALNAIALLFVYFSEVCLPSLLFTSRTLYIKRVPKMGPHCNNLRPARTNYFVFPGLSNRNKVQK